MAQVVTNENMLEFIQNRQVPEFKAPAKDEPAKPSEPAAVQADTPAKEQIAKAEQPRGDDGKFVKADGEKSKDESKAEDEPKEAAKAAENDDDEDADLPERVRRQIGKKHRQMKEAEEFARERDRHAAVAEARAAELQRRIEELEGKKSGSAPEKDAKAPKPEDFKTVAEYADALTEYKLEQKLAKYREEALKQQQKAHVERAQSEFAERIAKAMKDIPDYADVVEQADDNVPPHMAQYIVESDLGPLLGYHLAKHPDVLERLSKLSPVRAVAELGKLEATLEKKPEEKKPVIREVSRAPAPISPLEGKSAPVTKDPSQMTFAELRAHREAERKEGKYR